PQMRSGAACGARPLGHRVGRSRGPRCPCPLGRHPAQPAMSAAKTADTNRLVAVNLDEESIGRSSPDIDHERQVAIYDLIEENSFAPVGHKSGPYVLNLSLKENRLVFDIRREDEKPVIAHLLSLTPFKRIVKDYFMICDSYYSAIRTATPD